jgi:Ca2+-binding EF-hand superfamily protein
MKRVVVLLSGLGLVVLGVGVFAQPPDRGNRGRQGGPPPRGGEEAMPARGGRGDPRMMAMQPFSIPLVQVLDVDRDGVISAEEIDNAVSALKKLDQDGDGQLSGEEYLPRMALYGRGTMPGVGGPPGQADGEGALRQEEPAIVRRIKGYDKNQDGLVAREEYPARMMRQFEQLDANADGSLDEAEIAQAAERPQRRGRNRRGDNPQAVDGIPADRSVRPRS